MTRAGRLILAEAACAGREHGAAVAAWVDTHFDFIWRVLRRLGLQPADADDAAQQVFLIAMQKVDAIAPGQERRFLYGTAVRVAANARRARARRRESDASALELHAEAGRSPEQQLVLSEARALLDAVLERMPDELRRVLVLAEIEQLEVAEIAALEGLRPGTAASRLRRARAAFREHLARVQRAPVRSRREP